MAGGWRGSSAIKSVSCSRRGLGFGSQNPLSGLQLFVALIPGDPALSSDPEGHQALVMCVYTCGQSAHTHNIK